LVPQPPSFLQVLLGSALPTVTFAHVPFGIPVMALEQAWHCPVHVLSQQKPSTQVSPLMQLPVPVHALPWPSRPVQWPPVQKLPAVQSEFCPHDVAQSAPLQVA